MVGLVLAATEVFVLRNWNLSWWWLLLVPLVFACTVIAVGSRQQSLRLAAAERQRDAVAAELDRRISELFSLRELTYVVSESLQLSHIVEQVARYAARFLQANGAIVVLEQPDGAGWHVAAAEGVLGDLLGESSDGAGSLVGAAIARGRVEVTKAGAERGVTLFGSRQVTSAAVVPLQLRGERIGAIAVTDRRDGSFTTEDLWLLSTVATNASVALANSRLFGIVERGRREWETTFDALREGIAVIGPDGAIQRANSALAHLAGLSEEALVGRPFQTAIFGDLEAPAALIANARQGEAQGPAVIRVAPRRFLRLAASPLTGVEGSVVALVEDVTEQRALEAQLFQNEKMAAIGQLVSGVAHELNNPLTSIAGLTELLLERGPPGDAPRQHLRVIHEQAERAGRIVRNLLTFVRHGTPDTEPFDLNDLVGRTIMLISYEIRLHDIELESRLSPEPVVVAGDRHELQQVLVNLVTNAVQALATLPESRSRRIVIETARDETHCRLVVRDSGDGVPAEYLANLFSPFFTTKEAGKGTGLGLSLSYGLVQAHGGTLTYADAPGGGAEFTVTLPSADAGPRLVRRGILVVDDDPATQRLVGALFSPDGFTVAAARTGTQALELVSTNDYALIIADPAVAAPSGTSFVRALLEADSRWHGRLIVSGRGDGDIGRRISKPFDLRRLRALAEEVIRDAGVSNPPPAPEARDPATPGP